MFKTNKSVPIEKETKSTVNLMKELLESKSFDSFNEANGMYFVDFNKYFDQLLLKKKLKRSRVVEKAGIHRTYANLIFRGKRPLNRDKVLLLALACELNLDETQELLKMASHSTLYPRIKRDSLIIIAVNHHLSIINANLLIYEHGESILE